MLNRLVDGFIRNSCFMDHCSRESYTVSTGVRFGCAPPYHSKATPVGAYLRLRC